MQQPILTDVSATVEPARDAELIAGFQEMIAGPIPDGLVRTDLLRGADGRWRIMTVWRDREALEVMRSATDLPAAPRLFRSVDAEPSVHVYEIAVQYVP